jgi:O-antigen/teichoic acid export membrane protein
MSIPTDNVAPASAAAIKTRVASGGVAVGLTTALRSILELGATLVTARLLTPADFGLVGMVLAVIGFVDMFKDLGLATVTVQRKELSRQQVSGLFWVTVAVGAVLAALTALAAPLISWGYGQPLLTDITLVLSSCLFVSALSVQHQALLKRELKFERLAIVQSVGTIAGVATVIGAALAGLGVWALVLRQLAGPLASGICALLLLRWVPGRPPGEGLRELFGMGGHVTGFQVSNYIERNLDNVLIGKFAGSFQLGCYTRAYDLLRLPLQQIADPASTIAIPTLSRLAGDAERYRSAYLRMAGAVLLLTVPLTPYMIVCADWLVGLAFGSQWSAAVPMFRVLGIGMLVKPVAFTMGWLFVSQGRTGEMMRWGFIATGLAVLSFVVGLPWGAIGVALSYALLDLVVRVPALAYWIGRRGPVATSDLISLLLPTLLGCGCVGAALLAFRWSVGERLHPALGCLLGALIALFVTAALIWSTSSGRRSFDDICHLFLRKKQES